MPNYKTSILLTLILLLTLSACTQPVKEKESNADLIVSVSILPQKYFVERIGGEHVSVNVMVGPGDSPHSYEPKASQMTALSDSDIYFQISVEFEDAWMERITAANPSMPIVDVSADITKSAIEAYAHNDDDKELILDPHVWTSPANGALIANAVAKTLIELDPQHADIYQANLISLLDDIETLQADIAASLEKLENGKFMVFHPSWGFFAQEFGLEQIAIEIGGSEPSARELAGILEKARSEHIHVIFAQPEFSTGSAEYIASEIDGKVILISPLAEDWLENLRLVANTFAEEL